MTRLNYSLVLLAVAGLAACSTGGTVWYAEGVTVASRSADLAQCRGQALSQHPVRQETRFRPPTYIPASEVCSRDGSSCTVIPARWEQGAPYTIDRNERARDLAADACMAGRGYAPITLQNCEDGTRVAATTRMPALTANTCLLQNRGPGPLVVNPA